MQTSFASFAILGAANIAHTAEAAPGYPTRPINVLIGFPAGGPMDVATRIVVDDMATALRGNAVVENKPGASATLVGRQAAIAAPDGHTLLMVGTANISVSRFIYAKLQYDPDGDFKPIGQFAVAQSVIYVNARSGIKSLPDLFSAWRANPQTSNYASPGQGGASHLTMEMLTRAEKIQAQHVPFKGSQPAVTAVVGNELTTGIDAIGPILAMLKAGKLTALAQTGERRSASLPNVPTLNELGYKKYPNGAYLGLMAPAKTPSTIIEVLEAQLQKSATAPSVQRRLQDMGLDVAYLDSASFAQAIKNELPFWESAVAVSGLKP